MNLIEKAMMEAKGGEQLIASANEQAHLAELNRLYGNTDPSWQAVATRKYGCKLGDRRKEQVTCVECTLHCNLDLGDIWTVSRLLSNVHIMRLVEKQSRPVDVNGIKMDVITNQLAILVCNTANLVFDGTITSPEKILELVELCDNLGWKWLADALYEIHVFYATGFLSFDEEDDSIFLSAEELGLDIG